LKTKDFSCFAGIRLSDFKYAHYKILIKNKGKSPACIPNPPLPFPPPTGEMDFAYRSPRSKNRKAMAVRVRLPGPDVIPKMMKTGRKSFYKQPGLHAFLSSGGNFVLPAKRRRVCNA
jgi:hypothetical protein